ncbi:hypothetical protein SAMN04487970_100965 [Paenibacillus tianmuensis]|uniref:Uncharacterized protein n=1 Tax=Paenibacillus tianmuensis TaxID=624147 RepID=A0A1G4QVL3_9BACL|nr:hypothetical protein [Paenibacillus tianmuensis]SCW48602.1 hypothetical protein SAMN04487970_100965 [Paenibacillus tianmuensis]
MKRKLGRHPSSVRDDRSLRKFKHEQLRREPGRKTHDEFAAEITYPGGGSRQERSRITQPVAVTENGTEEKADTSYRWLGYTALVLSILAWFLYPALLGSTSALLGLFAYMLGERSLGTWSIIIGLIALGGYFILVPLYA